MPSLSLPKSVAPQAATLSNDVLEAYARRTTKRPLTCFLVIAAMPFVTEAICRVAEALL